MTITHDNENQALKDFERLYPNLSKGMKEGTLLSNWDKTQAEFQEALGGADEEEFFEPPNEQLVKAAKEYKSPKMIRRFPSGAVRSDDTGRIRPDYLSPYALTEIAEHFTIAKNDFGPTNYFKGIKPEEVLPSVMRHMLEIQEGLMIGNKTMVRNAFRSLGANSIMALHQIVLEEKGLYKEVYDKTELVNMEYAKANQDTD